MELKYKFRVLAVVLLTVFGVVLALVFLYPKIQHWLDPSGSPKDASVEKLCPGCKDHFQDRPNRHNRAYRYEGIRPQRDFRGLDRLKRQGILVPIPKRSYHSASKAMTSSRPYLLPNAVAFLDTLGHRYRRRLGAHPMEPFIITSATRSIQSNKKLMKSNKNASGQSFHLRGKTLDISYAQFRDDSCRRAFILSLKELHKLNQCFVKHEIKQQCLHITVN